MNQKNMLKIVLLCMIFYVSFHLYGMEGLSSRVNENHLNSSDMILSDFFANDQLRDSSDDNENPMNSLSMNLMSLDTEKEIKKIEREINRRESRRGRERQRAYSRRNVARLFHEPYNQRSVSRRLTYEDNQLQQETIEYEGGYEAELDSDNDLDYEFSLTQNSRGQGNLSISNSHKDKLNQYLSKKKDIILKIEYQEKYAQECSYIN